jgi:hypothetical protein
MYWRVGSRAWNIFWLSPDRSFWGETLDHNDPPQGIKDLRGTLSSADYQRFISLAQAIRACPPRPMPDPEKIDGDGFLAEGTWHGKPVFIFRRFETQPAPVHDKLFADLVDLMKNYV